MSHVLVTMLALVVYIVVKDCLAINDTNESMNSTGIVFQNASMSSTWDISKYGSYGGLPETSGVSWWVWFIFAICVVGAVSINTYCAVKTEKKKEDGKNGEYIQGDQ